MQLLVVSVTYLPTEQIAVLVEGELGGRFHINTTESVADSYAAPGVPWSNAEVVQAAQAALDDPDGQFGTGRPAGGLELAGLGHVVAWPPPVEVEVSVAIPSPRAILLGKLP
jgi:hypothetical protein